MSIIGRRGASGSGWSWYRPPPRRRAPSPLRSALALAGLGLIVLAASLAALGVWLSESGDSATPSPTSTALPSPAATLSPTPADQEPAPQLAAWDGRGWQFAPRLEAAAYREGEAVPILLRVDDVLPGSDYWVTLRYPCSAFDLLTGYSRDRGVAPALAPGGPGTALPDTILLIPDDPGTAADDGEEGAFNLWGGSVSGVGTLRPPSACRDEKALTVSVSAAADTLFLIWGAQLADGASHGAAAMRLSVQVAGQAPATLEIDPESVEPAAP